MIVLWIMVGLTSVVTLLLILNLKIFRKTKAERKLLDAKTTADKEAVFQKNCVAFGLSVREIEVLRLILAGHTYKSAAEILFLSEKTIDAHLRSIYSKTGVKNKVELVVRFYS
jgi:DNA-binding CsgD family transcriptional regulator